MKRKVIIAIAISIISLIISGVYATGRIYTDKNIDDLKDYVDSTNLNIQILDSEYQVLNSQAEEVLNQIRESRKQTALLQNQYSRLNLDRSQHSKKLAQQKLIEKYQLQVEYYNVSLMIEQLELAKLELEVMNKKIDVEEEKLLQGLSTPLVVDDLMSQRKQLISNVTNIEKRIEHGKSLLKARLNESGDAEFNPEFAIPNAVDNSEYSLSLLKQNLKNKNLSLEKINAYISYQDSLISSIKSSVGTNDRAYVSAIAEKNNLLSEKNLLNQQMELYVENKYIEFKQKVASYIYWKERNGVLNTYADVLGAKYQNGDISLLQYMEEGLKISSEIYNVKLSIVEKKNSHGMINLILNGVMMK